MVLFGLGGSPQTLRACFASRMPVLYRPRVLRKDGYGGGDLDSLLDETRELLVEAGVVIDGSLGEAARDSRDPVGGATILTLYDELRGRLDGIDDRRLKELLGRIARNLEALSSLDDEVERVRRLREALGRF